MDESLLLWINQGWAHPWLDLFFSWISQKQAFSFPLLLAILALLARRFGWIGVKFWLLLVAVIITGDLFGNILKHLTAQPRPCAALPELVRLVEKPFRVGCSIKPLGMPSNHALNFFLACTFLGLVLRSRILIIGLELLAAAVALSRIYLGVHYPSQALAGTLIGIALGLLAVSAATRYVPFMARLRQHVK